MLSTYVLPEDIPCCIFGESFDLGAASGARINLNRTFLVAYLLTRDMETAESAILLALESWTPEKESGEDLFRKILQAALGSSIGPASSAAVCHLPRKLQNVLELAAPLRRSFVLRILVGLPVDVCAELLNIGSQLFNSHLRCALVSLGSRTSDGLCIGGRYQLGTSLPPDRT